jgi:hypothetical protein
MSKRDCYFCGKPATSKEHVPPRCLFSEGKDAFGKDHRKNLITVPSCDEHDLEKSKDDEFLMVCLTPTVGNNSAGLTQTRTKLKRAIGASEGRLLRTVIKGTKEITVVTPDGTKFPVLVGEHANLPRLHTALEHVARGLYFHETGKRFVGACNTFPSFIRYPEDPDLEFIRIIGGRLVAQEKRNWRIRRKNLDVFQYRLGPPDQYGLIPMLMTFFRGSDVYVSFMPEGVKLPFRTLAEATPENPVV